MIHCDPAILDCSVQSAAPDRSNCSDPRPCLAVGFNPRQATRANSSRPATMLRKVPGRNGSSAICRRWVKTHGYRQSSLRDGKSHIYC